MQRLILLLGTVLFAVVLWLALAGGDTTAATSAAQPNQQLAAIDGAPALTPSASPSPTCAPSWAVVQTENVETELDNRLLSVDALSTNNVWAVGTYLIEGTSRHKSTPKKLPGAPPDKQNPEQYSYIARTLIEHWDGTAWSIVPSPNEGDDHNEIVRVSAISPTDVWAVGYYVSVIGVAQTLTEHWDGSAWQIVPSANTTDLQDNELASVEAVASNDVWAVGYASDETGRTNTLIEHWDGTAWSIVASPNLGAHDNELVDLAAISSTDVWAVGYYLSDTGNGNVRTLALHWDGSAWSVVSTPAVGTGYNIFAAIDGAASNDVWAVGQFYSNGGGYRMLMEHWDGSAWHVVAPPSVGGASADLNDIDAFATNDVWVVGNIFAGSGYGPQGLSLHWDGSAWQIVRGVNSSDFIDRFLVGVVAVAPQDVWAVGSTSGSPSGPYPQTLAEHYSTACVSCPLRFSDVPEGSPFFAAIECLACQGIVSGYTIYPPPPPPVPSVPAATGTPGPPGTPSPTFNPLLTPSPFPSPQVVFRPNNNVTRGQLAKIVSNSAGYQENPGDQMFQDVYPFSEFYEYVNRLARRGILTGYPCGGPGTPCVPPDNLPYFRTNNNATRGQIAKIISNAAGYSEPHTEQSFADVPASNTFYIYIARLYSRNIVSGYPCGHQGEPCVPPGNLPYFRPNNNATRGQTAKMDSKALLPNCYVP
jgi:hypothetical protein